MKIAIKKYGDELNWVDAEEIIVNGIPLKDILSRLVEAEKTLEKVNQFAKGMSQSIIKKFKGVKTK